MFELFFGAHKRVFDASFGEYPVVEAEAGIPYDENMTMFNKEISKRKKYSETTTDGFFAVFFGLNSARER